MSEPTINIGKVKVPLLDYAVSCNAILGIRDSGKTVTAKGIAEQLLDHNIPIIVFDAVGKWRWMKVPGPGAHGRGYKVVVAGGRKPDLALNPHSVGEIVRSAVKEKIPLIIDLYDPNLSKADWRKIVKESIRIIHYEAVGVAHVFLEEAAEFIPQRPTDFETYAEVEKLARMGGNASVGITLINQRAQEVNKAVLDLAVNLILGCQVGSKAIEWVGKWLDRLSPETSKAVTTSLPKLKSGEDWVWTRSNLDEPLREQMPMCRSLHPDRRTPEVDLKSSKAVDPEAFVKKLEASIPRIIEEAKANDPKEWAKQKRELTNQIKKLESAQPADGKTKTETVEKRIAIAADITRLELVLKGFDHPIERIETLLERAHQERSHIKVAINEARELNGEIQPALRPGPVSVTLSRVNRTGTMPAARPSAPPVPVQPKSAPADDGDFEFTQPMRSILSTIRALNIRGITASRDSVARWLGIHPNGGRYGSNLAALRANGYLNGFDLTAAGLAEAGDPQTGIDAARAALTEKPMQTIFDILTAESGFTRDTLAQKLGIHPNGGRYGSNLAWLRTMGLIPERGTIELTEGAWR